MRAEPATVEPVERPPAEAFPGEVIDRPASRPDDDLLARLEAVLFAAPRAMASRHLAEALDTSAAQVDQAVDRLNVGYATTDRAFRIAAGAGGWRMKTLDRFDDTVRHALDRSTPRTLGPGARETLAIVAYRQPVLRTDVEAIRGVASGEMLRQLLDEKLIRIRGRADLPGRPMLYGTTEKLLDLLGLQRLEQLPEVD